MQLLLILLVNEVCDDVMLPAQMSQKVGVVILA